MKQTLLCLTLLLVVNAAKSHDIHPLTSASSFFAQLLYQKIALNESTVAFSPYSIHGLLSMITLGATGATFEELERTLGTLHLPRDLVLNGYRNIIKELHCLSGFEIRSLNIILVPPTTQVLLNYAQALQIFFYTGVGRYDYTAIGGPERPINDFVEGKTFGYIPGRLPAGFITQASSLTGLSFFTFRGAFRDPFDPAKTGKRRFVGVCEASTQVELMNDVRFANVRTNVLSSTVLELPFVGDRVSFYAVLPNSLEDLSHLEGSLTNPDNLNQLFSGLKPCYTKISIPKFKVLCKFSGTEALKQLGITRSFSRSRAEFRDISQSSSLYVSQLAHSLYFEVSEFGSSPFGTAAPVPRPVPIRRRGPQITFNADRPFLFFVRDNLSQQLLVQGKFSG